MDPYRKHRVRDSKCGGGPEFDPRPRLMKSSVVEETDSVTQGETGGGLSSTTGPAVRPTRGQVVHLILASG